METKHQISPSIAIALGIISLVAVGALVSTGLLWNKLSQLQLAGAEASAEAEVESLIGEISEVLALPQGEMPSLITLTEAELEAVRGQAFFANALAGDKLLVYSTNSKAILWRPTAKKIIEASIINTAPIGEAAIN